MTCSTTPADALVGPRVIELRAPVAVARTPGLARRHPWLSGFLLGIVFVLGLQALLNRTRLADWLVQPLILSDTGGRGEAIVVLGAGATERCAPNVYAFRRVLLAVKLFEQGRAPLMLITGGRSGTTPCGVADVMADLAVRLGVPRSRVLLETRSHSTWENAVFSDAILRANGAHRLVVVTDRLHMRRAESCFRHLGYEVERAAVPSPESHPDNLSMLRMAMREGASNAYYWARGRFAAPVAAALTSGSPNHTGKEPAKVETSAVESGTATSPDGPVVILGASYAKGWHPSLTGMTVVNKGVEGQQTFELLERFDRDVVALSPRAVVLWGFINDIFRAPTGGIDASLTRARESITTMAKKARAAGIVPVLATEVTIRPPNTWGETFGGWLGAIMGKQSYQDRINAHVAATNQWLVSYARQEGILVLDFQRALAEPSGRRRVEFADPDGSHIPAAGYEALTHAAVPILERELPRP